jgi:hypothetical protein
LKDNLGLKDVKELVYGGFGRITNEVWAKAEDHVLKIENEYGKENCIDGSEIKGLSLSTFCLSLISFCVTSDL